MSLNTEVVEISKNRTVCHLRMFYPGQGRITMGKVPGRVLVILKTSFSPELNAFVRFQSCAQIGDFQNHDAASY